MKLKHIALIGSLFPILFSLVLFFGVLISADSDDENSNFSSGITGMNLSAEVLKHQPMVEKYAREYGISEYVNVLLAIIQVESGGTAEDVMQSSESLGLPPNSLDTESSIKQGCKYFASLLSSCKNQGIDDLDVAIQSYNYGGGYVGYVAGKGKKHTFNLAESFAREKSGGKKVTYTNPIAVAKNGGWRYGYGNMFYVELLNQYLTVAHFDNATAQAIMNEALKYQGWKYVYGGSNPNTSFDCKDKKVFTKKIGIGTLLVSIGILVMPIINLISHSELGYYIGLILIVVGVFYIIFIIVKYNGKLISFKK